MSRRKININTTSLYLIRHGATLLTEEDRFSGGTEVDLSDEGRLQVSRLAERISGKNLVAVYCSPMRRTVETAKIICKPYGFEPIPADGLREVHHGHWETMKRSEVEAQFPEEYANWQEDPFTFAPQGGESGLMVTARALPVIRDIVVHHSGQAVGVVSHKATIRLILCILLGIDARGYRDRLDQCPASLNILDFKDPVRARLMLFNDISHYLDQPPPSKNRLSHWFSDEKK